MSASMLLMLSHGAPVAQQINEPAMEAVHIVLMDMQMCSHYKYHGIYVLY